MRLSKSVREKYLSLLRELLEDLDSWEVRTEGCVDISSTDYYSKIYTKGEYRFQFSIPYGGIPLHVTCMIRGKLFENVRLGISPFSEEFQMIWVMKRYLKNIENDLSRLDIL